MPQALPMLPVPRPPFHATTMIPAHLAATRQCQWGEMAWTAIHLFCDITDGLPSDCRGVCASNSCAHNKISWKQQQLHTQHTTAWCKSQFLFGTYVVNLWCSYISTFWGFLIAVGYVSIMLNWVGDKEHISFYVLTLSPSLQLHFLPNIVIEA
jgi:hypothetical protein